jgi:4a-hydroxytetrahydrobiopterin dehydratase
MRLAPRAGSCRSPDRGVAVTERILSRQFHGSDGVEAWRVLADGACAFFRTDSFAASARFVDAIGGLIGPGEPPDVDVRGTGVTVRINAIKGRDYGLVQADLDLARAISATARELGLRADPAAIQGISIIPGATDRHGIMPFWQAVLGYDPRSDSPDEDLVDPQGRLAPFWFEEMDELRADGSGTIHLVIWVPWDAAEARVAAGLAAGGRIVRHVIEEGFWTLADPAGNEVDVASTSAPDRSD